MTKALIFKKAERVLQAEDPPNLTILALKFALSRLRGAENPV